MSILFSDESSEYLTIDDAPMDASPVSMACWYYPDEDGTNSMGLVGIGSSTDNSQYYALRLMGAITNDPIRAYSRNTSTEANSQSGSASTFNQWNHAAGVWASDTSRIAYCNGIAGTENTTSVTPDLTNRRTRIAVDARGGGLGPPFSGRIAEVAIWNIALTSDDVAILNLGFSPKFVRPEYLVFYMPLVKDVYEDTVGGFSLAANGTPIVASHPPIIYPISPIIMMGIAAGGTTPKGVFGKSILGPFGGPI